MFDIKAYYKSENEKILNSYNKTTDRIKRINRQTAEYQNTNFRADKKNKYLHYCNILSANILKCIEHEKELSNEYFETTSLEELKQINNSFFNELIAENYKTCFANPEFAVDIIGDDTGKLLASFYMMCRQCSRYAYLHELFSMEVIHRSFIELYEYICSGDVEYQKLKDIVIKPVLEPDAEKEYKMGLDMRFNRNFKFFSDIAVKPDLSDLRYLFRYGTYISEYELTTARFINNYPEDQIKLISKIIVDAYFDGFKRDNKTPGKRNNVTLIYKVGQERIYRQVINDFSKRDMHCLVAGCTTTATNKQYFFDHKFDMSLHLNAEYVDERINAYRNALNSKKNILSYYSGVVAVASFGEPPFSPEAKKANIILSEEQRILYQDFNSEMNKAYYEYVPREKTSFSCICFPSPEIGPDYEAVFKDIFSINTLDQNEYLKIQQHMIDLLDRADYVRVKGRNGNKTDITVQLQKLENPQKETLFENCGANINIPVGEVFTSPRLAGTNGTLHVGDIYLRDLRYKNLTLLFKDGYITDYSCTNYENEEENKKFIRDNLLFPHETLPMGEFAIGTNTLAYALSKKHNIINKLPILIVEKMGPHFAVGDTCFSRREDHKVFNVLDKKEIIARDNEKSLMRKTDYKNAYTNKHTDISLPYEEIGLITAVGKDGSTDIIKDSRFVLAGTEELNKPLNGM